MQEIHKYTSKEVLKLQNEVDAVMAFITISSHSNKESNLTSPLDIHEYESKVLNNKSNTTKESNSIETNKNLKCHNAIANNNHETLISKLKNFTIQNHSLIQPIEQPQKQIKDLLWKLLNKLPKLERFKAFEDENVRKNLDIDDSTLIFEVAKKLSFFKKQQKDMNTNIRCLNKGEFSTDSFVHDHIEKQEESTMSNMITSEYSNNGVRDGTLHSMCNVHEEPNLSTKVDNATYHNILESNALSDEFATSILERANDFPKVGEDFHVALDIDSKINESKLSVLEPSTSPTKLELYNLVETLATNFVDVVFTHTKDAIDSLKSMVENKESILELCKFFEDFSYFYEKTLYEMSNDRINLPLQFTNINECSVMGEAPKFMNIEEKKKTNHLTSIEISNEKIQLEKPIKDTIIINEKNTSDIFKAFEVDNNDKFSIVQIVENHEDASQKFYRNECIIDNRFNDSSINESICERSKICCQNVIGDNEGQTLELTTHQKCNCNRSKVHTKISNKEVINLDSTKFFANEKDLRVIDLKNDATSKKIVPVEVAHNSLVQETLSLHNKVKIEGNNALRETSLSNLANCYELKNSMNLWNGLDLTCIEDTTNEDTIKIEVINDNILERTCSLNLISCSKNENITSLWNGLDSTCHKNIVNKDIVKVEVENDNVQKEDPISNSIDCSKNENLRS